MFLRLLKVQFIYFRRTSLRVLSPCIGNVGIAAFKQVLKNTVCVPYGHTKTGREFLTGDLIGSREFLVGNELLDRNRGKLTFSGNENGIFIGSLLDDHTIL